MQKLEVQVATGVDRYTPLAGEYNYIQLDSRQTANVTIVDKDGNQEYYLKPGRAARLQPFSRLFISHDGAGTENLVMWLANDGEEGDTQEFSGDVDLQQSSSISTDVVAVSTVSVAIIAASSSRRGALLRNEGGVTVWLGASGVTGSTDGYPLKPGEKLNTRDLGISRAAVYGITATGTANIHVIGG